KRRCQPEQAPNEITMLRLTITSCPDGAIVHCPTCRRALWNCGLTRCHLRQRARHTSVECSVFFWSMRCGAVTCVRCGHWLTECNGGYQTPGATTQLSAFSISLFM